MPDQAGRWEWLVAEAWIERARAVWDERAAEWDERSEANTVAPDRADDLRRTAEALRLEPGSVVLDAGCGSGQFAIAFAELGCRVTGVDLSPEMIARARNHAEARGVAVELRVGEVGELSDSPAIYDAVHARVVLQFVPDLASVLREFRRVLKPEGRLYASVPGALSPIYSRSWRRFVAPEELGANFVVPWEFEALLGEGGWTVVDEWSEFGQSLTGETNPLSPTEVAALPRRLQQAAATTWTFIAT